MASFAHLDEKKILRKMDLRLIPMLALLYLLSFLDRGNIGNAKIEGLTEDLGMSGSQYNWCLTVNNPPAPPLYIKLPTSKMTDMLNVGILLHIRRLRSALEPTPQETPAIDLASDDNGSVGDSDDAYGNCAVV